MLDMKTTALFLALASFALPGLAQEKEQKSPSYFSHTGYLSLGSSSFDQETAEAEGIEDDATTFRLGWMAQKESFLIGAGMGIYGYSDNEGFSQRVERDYGGASTEDSSASGVSAYGQIGYALRANEAISFDALVGLEAMLTSERSISYCSNCYAEDIDIDAGLYFEPRFRVNAGNGFVFSLSYRQYLSGDIENTFGVSFGWVFWDYM